MIRGSSHARPSGYSIKWLKPTGGSSNGPCRYQQRFKCLSSSRKRTQFWSSRKYAEKRLHGDSRKRSSLPNERRAYFQSATTPKEAEYNFERTPAKTVPDQSLEAGTRTLDKSDNGPVTLVLSPGTKALDESDFRRAVPMGHHIPGWRAMGDIEKVTQSYHRTSLEPISRYMINFSSKSSAEAFQTHIIKSHALLKKLLPGSMISVPKPRDTDGLDVTSVIQNFTLVPRSRPLNLTKAESSKTLKSQRFWRVAPEDRDRRTVLIHVSGNSIDTHLIAKKIQQDGKSRALPWKVVGIHKIEPGDSSQQQEQSKDAESKREKPKSQRPVTSWKVTLEDENESRRFIRMWHRRPSHLDTAQEYEPPMRAELLW